jgi:uncharacterized protein YjbI with pentapeptide repeats
MKQIDGKTFREMLRLRALWLQGDPAGKRATFANIRVTNDDPNGLLIDARLQALHLIDFSGSHFTGIDFEGSDFTCADCSSASFVACNFSSVTLAHANFSHVKPVDSVFFNAEFFGTDIRGTNFDDSRISGSATSHSLLRVGPIYGEMMTAVRWMNEPRIVHGVDHYTVRQAKVRYASDARKRAGLYALLALARSNGWSLPS